MTRTLLAMCSISLVTLAATGCMKGSKQSSAAGSSKGGSAGDGGFGVVQNVRGAAKRTVTANELHNLQLYIDGASAEGRMPTKQMVLDAAQKEDRKLYDALMDGSLVYAEPKAREGVWAYEKDAPTQGGMILTSSGIERVTAGEFKLKMGQ